MSLFALTSLRGLSVTELASGRFGLALWWHRCYSSGLFVIFSLALCLVRAQRVLGMMYTWCTWSIEGVLSFGKRELSCCREREADSAVVSYSEPSVVAILYMVLIIVRIGCMRARNGFIWKADGIRVGGGMNETSIFVKIRSVFI